MKIVIVDPSRVVQKILSATLEDAHHAVICHPDGASALERLRVDPDVDVLVTSLQLKGMSGLELVRSARDLAGSRRALHVLVMSSSSERSTLIEALDSGADDFIGKPPAPDELLARLRVAERAASLKRDLIRLATVDAMTGVMSRRAFFEIAASCPRSGADAVAIFDIDRFKQINDTFGHPVGDVVLIAVAQAAAARCAAVGRLGGEEFGLLLPGETLKEAIGVCELIRRDVAALTFSESATLRPTCSFGAGQWRSSESVDDALKRADVALYAAKSGGRNRVVAATSPGEETAVMLSTPSARRLA